VPVIGVEESEQLRIRGALHSSGPNIHESRGLVDGRNRLRVRQAESFQFPLDGALRRNY
jgi:hypothetical protein